MVCGHRVCGLHGHCLWPSWFLAITIEPRKYELIRFWGQKVKGQAHIIAVEASNTLLFLRVQVSRSVLNYACSRCSDAASRPRTEHVPKRVVTSRSSVSSPNSNRDSGYDMSSESGYKRSPTSATRGTSIFAAITTVTLLVLLLLLTSLLCVLFKSFISKYCGIEQNILYWFGTRKEVSEL